MGSQPASGSTAQHDITMSRAAAADSATALSELARLGSDPDTRAEGNLRALMRWEEANVTRISGEIPGTDPQLGDQTIVVFAYYDSTSVVPALSPGAESARSSRAASGLAGSMKVPTRLRLLIALDQCSWAKWDMPM